MKKRNSTLLLSVGAIALVAAVYVHSAFTLFVIQPIGALPEGRTIVIRRLNNMNFVESADGVCLRIQSRVNLLCRMGVLAGVMKNTAIYARLPYSRSLYLISTNDQEFDR